MENTTSLRLNRTVTDLKDVMRQTLSNTPHLLDVPVIILSATFQPSTSYENTECAVITLETEEHVLYTVQTMSKVLVSQLKELSEHFPLRCQIIRVKQYYTLKVTP